MLWRTSETYVEIDAGKDEKELGYIVQPISYIEISDCVSPENSVQVEEQRGMDYADKKNKTKKHIIFGADLFCNTYCRMSKK